jgi:CheY-like chemotaxis protein
MAGSWDAILLDLSLPRMDGLTLCRKLRDEAHRDTPVLRNSIMLISHYEHLVHVEGQPWNPDTAVRGAAERLVPILMTALGTAAARRDERCGRQRDRRADADRDTGRADYIDRAEPERAADSGIALRALRAGRDG